MVTVMVMVTCYIEKKRKKRENRAREINEEREKEKSQKESKRETGKKRTYTSALLQYTVRYTFQEELFKEIH